MPACGWAKPSPGTWWRCASARRRLHRGRLAENLERLPRRRTGTDRAQLINYRLPVGSVHAWELAKGHAGSASGSRTADAQQYRPRRSGRSTVGRPMPRELVRPLIQARRLRGAHAWCPFQGYHSTISRRHLSRLQRLRRRLSPAIRGSPAIAQRLSVSTRSKARGAKRTGRSTPIFGRNDEIAVCGLRQYGR